MPFDTMLSGYRIENIDFFLLSVSVLETPVSTRIVQVWYFIGFVSYRVGIGKSRIFLLSLSGFETPVSLRYCISVFLLSVSVFKSSVQVWYPINQVSTSLDFLYHRYRFFRLQYRFGIGKSQFFLLLVSVFETSVSVRYCISSLSYWFGISSIWYQNILFFFSIGISFRDSSISLALYQFIIVLVWYLIGLVSKNLGFSSNRCRILRLQYRIGIGKSRFFFYLYQALGFQYRFRITSSVC